MVLLVIGLTALLALLDRAGRRRLRDDELQRLAFEDSLTGLPNRALFEQRIAETLAAGEPAMVAFLDLDDFKQVNDSLGHAAGDRLLEICGERLRHALRAERHRRPPRRRRVRDPRPRAPTSRTRSSTACSTCSRAPVDARGQAPAPARQRSASRPPTSGDDLLRNADLAMYAAKAAGTNRYAVFTDDMHVHALARLDRREQLERAIENEELVLHYQPIVDLDLGRVAGFEALGALAASRPAACSARASSSRWPRRPA